MLGKKSLLLIGGSGELGNAITQKFIKTRFKKWKVFNVDFVPNKDATQNFILPETNTFSLNTIETLHKELKGFAEEYDSVINVAGTDTNEQINSSQIFDVYEKIQKAEIMSSLMTVHLASNFLSPNGYVVFTSDIESYKSFSKNPLESMAKKVEMQTALNLSIDRSQEGLIFANACVNVLILGTLQTIKNKKLYPSANYFDWTPLEGIARMLKMWSAGEHRPENGSFVGFRTEKKGKIIFPTYY